jgi:hypothetical protein
LLFIVARTGHFQHCSFFTLLHIAFFEFSCMEALHSRHQLGDPFLHRTTIKPSSSVDIFVSKDVLFHLIFGPFCCPPRHCPPCSLHAHYVPDPWKLTYLFFYLKELFKNYLKSYLKIRSSVLPHCTHSHGPWPHKCSNMLNLDHMHIFSTYPVWAARSTGEFKLVGSFFF